MADEVRLIDARALKEYMCSACPNKGRCEDTEQVCSAILDVDEQPTIEAEPDNGWISVEERLPENETEVLIYCPEFVCTIKLAMWIEDGFDVDKEDLIVKAAPNGYCTHWQPLPKPPKGE